jgi:hypothetical protein
MPMALLRLAVNNRLPLTRDMTIDWKFYGELGQIAAPPSGGGGSGARTARGCAEVRARVRAGIGNGA